MAIVFDPHHVPRKTPWIVKVGLFFDDAILIALGTLAFAAGTFFLAGLLSLNTFRSLVFYGPFSFGRGEIVYVNGTSIYVGRARPGNEIVEYRYQYKVGGEVLNGVAYGHGKSVVLKAGTPLKIEYRIEKPDWSRVDSWSTLEKPDWSRYDHWSTTGAHLSMTKTRIEQLAAPAFFSLIGAILLCVATRRGLKNIDLVTNGIVTRGKVVNDASVTLSLHKRRSSGEPYKFKTPQGVEMTAYVNTLLGPSPGASEMLVYDYRRPQNAVRLQSLPKSVQKMLAEPVQVERQVLKPETDESADPLRELGELDSLVRSQQEPTKKASLKSVLLNGVILGCIAALGVFEFSLLLRHLPEEVMTIGITQTVAGLFMLGAGSLLISPALSFPRQDKPAQMRSVVTLIGTFSTIAGLVMFVSAAAGLLYVGYREFFST